MGPVGLLQSIHELLPILSNRPAVVFLQDTRLTKKGIERCKATLRNAAPEYCLVPNPVRSTKPPFTVRTAIIIHRGWVHALGPLDAKNLQNGEVKPMLLKNVQAITHVDPHLGTKGLWINVYSPIAPHREKQADTLWTINRILQHRTNSYTFTILAGDWNASLVARTGCQCTETADTRFKAWFQANNLKVISSRTPTFLSVAQRNYRATLDYIFMQTMINGAITHAYNKRTGELKHDHKGLHCIIQGVPCSNLPRLEEMLSTPRLDKSQWPTRKERWKDKVEFVVANCTHGIGTAS